MRLIKIMLAEVTRDVKSSAKNVAEVVFSKDMAICALFVLFITGAVGVGVLAHSAYSTTPITLAAIFAYCVTLTIIQWVYGLAQRAQQQIDQENKEMMSTLKGEDHDDPDHWFN